MEENNTMILPTKQYVGPRGVMAVVIEADKTYSGADVVTVNYDGGYSELMTKKTYELVATNEPSDFTAVRNKKFNAMYNEIYPLIAEYLLNITKSNEDKSAARQSFLEKAMALLTEFDIKVSEIEPFLNQIIAELNGATNAIGYELDNTFNRASNFLWTKKDTDFIPGTNMMMERSLLEAKRVTSIIPAVVVEAAKEVPVEEIPANDEPESTPAE